MNYTAQDSLSRAIQENEVFGRNIFNTTNLTFEPSVNLAVLTDDAQGAGIGIGRKAAGVVDKGGQALVVLHFVLHGALYVALDFH